MPIYEYICNSCGIEKEHLQKMSEVPITICPACGSGDYTKLISAAGFQLKGSGWYVTDFKNRGTQQPESKSNQKSKDDVKNQATAPSAVKTTDANSTPTPTPSTD